MQVDIRYIVTIYCGHFLQSCALQNMEFSIGLDRYEVRGQIRNTQDG